MFAMLMDLETNLLDFPPKSGDDEDCLPQPFFLAALGAEEDLPHPFFLGATAEEEVDGEVSPFSIPPPPPMPPPPAGVPSFITLAMLIDLETKLPDFFVDADFPHPFLAMTEDDDLPQPFLAGASAAAEDGGGTPPPPALDDVPPTAVDFPLRTEDDDILP